MKIQHLIEAPIYRWQEEWKGNTEPSIHMSGRQERRVRGNTAGPTLEFTYGLELNDVDCPKRWKSTFCTTNTERSGFLESPLTSDGIRQIIIPDNVPVATVRDDFNLNSYGTSVLYAAMETADNIHQSEVMDSDTMKQWMAWVDIWNECMYNPNANDVAYEQFKQAIATYDQLIADKRVRPNWIPAVILYHNGLKDAIAYYGQQIIDSGKFNTYDSVSQIPEGKNLEVWFEGDYQAVLVNQPD